MAVMVGDSGIVSTATSITDSNFYSTTASSDSNRDVTGVSSRTSILNRRANVPNQTANQR